MNKSYGIFGVAVESGSTPPSAPSCSFHASADSPGIDASTSTEPVRLSTGARDTTVGRYISGSEQSAEVTTIADAKSLPYLLLGALGSVETSGSAAPYAHSFKMGESLPALTFFQQVGASNAALQSLSGCKVDNLSIEASGTTPPAVHVKLAGCKAKWLSATTWSGPAFSIDEGYFKTLGAEVLFSLATSTPTDPPESVTLSKISVEISNNTTSATELGESEPDKQVEGAASVSVSIEGTTDSTELYRIVKTGSASGTTLAQAIVTGSVQVTFPHTAEDWDLVLKLLAVPWEIDAMNVGVEGGPFDLRLSTSGAIAVDGTSIEVIVENDVSSYSS